MQAGGGESCVPSTQLPNLSPLHPSYLPAGAETLQRLLTDSLLDSFFPNPSPHLLAGAETLHPLLTDSLPNSFSASPPPPAPLYLPAGAETLQRLLTDSLPDSFFPNALPFSTKDGYTVLNMCSVQVGAQGPGR